MPPVASQLGQVLDELLSEGAGGITSKRSLARRLHQLDARQSFESWQRTLKRYWSEGTVPEESTMALIEQAFEMPPGSIERPQRPTVAHLLDRLEEHEERAQRSRLAAVAALAAIDIRLSRIEAALQLPDGRVHRETPT